MAKNCIEICSVLLILMVALTQAVPKYDETKNTYPDNKWRRAYYGNERLNETTDEAVNKERIQRLGFTTGYGGINGYPHSGTGVGTYTPVKIDVGGIVLGTLVGIGAILIIPKLIGVFSGGYGHYARSTDNELSGLTEMLTKIDDVLGQNNIDSTSCMQRAVCNYMRSTETSIKTGSADQSDQLIHTLAGNSLVDYILNGTAIKEALENGKNINGSDCDLIYSACPLDSNSAMQIMAKLIPKNTQ